MKKHQQGDVLINPIARLPKNAKPVAAKNGRYILAEGEATGHAHAIEATPDVELYEVDGRLYLRVLAPVELRHEEHGLQVLEPGIAEVGQVVEVDPFEGEIRTVMD